MTLIASGATASLHAAAQADEYGTSAATAPAQRHHHHGWRSHVPFAESSWWSDSALSHSSDWTSIWSGHSWWGGLDWIWPSDNAPVTDAPSADDPSIEDPGTDPTESADATEPAAPPVADAPTAPTDEAPVATATAEPTVSDTPSAEPPATSEPTVTADPTVTAEPLPTMTVAPEPSVDPTPTPTVAPNPVPTPTVTPTPTPAPTMTSAPAPAPTPTVTVAPPAGNTNSVSGVAMPQGDLPGWKQYFSDDFTGTDLSSAWGRYSGQPGGDPAGYWLPTHAVVNSGALSLDGFKDSGYDASGGVAAWGASQLTYGKYEVRFRADAGNGYGLVFLLWPASENWPGDGEIDFAEDGATDRQDISATVHYGANNAQIQRSLHADFTKWHTVGVEWTAGKLVYTIDGAPWATVTGSMVPTKPMFLAMQEQALECTQWSACVDGTTPAKTSVQIDWVKVYTPDPSTATP